MKKPYDNMTPWDEVDYSCRVYNRLKDLRVKTVGDIRQYTEAELLSIPGFGRTSLKELIEEIGPIGRRLPPPLTPQLPGSTTLPPQPKPYEVRLTWSMHTGVWEDQAGNTFNLWRVYR